jgi:nicotinamide mononucleotide transporter
VKKFIKNELSNWNIFEIVWLVLASCSIVGLSLYWKDSWYGIVSALAGVICVILTGKGKLSAYIFGVINCILYGFISFKQGLYGETMLNILYYLPLQFYGFIVWNRNMNDTDNEVKRISMPNIERFKKLGLIILSTFIYGVFLKYIKDPMPYMDSFTTTAAVFAMWLSCRRYTEQWYLWVSINIVSVYIWWTRYSIGGDNIATLLMWIIFLINSIYGLIKWNRK